MAMFITKTTTIYTPPKLRWYFPKAAKFGRVIPKEKLYQQVGAGSHLKQRFVDQVAQIKWAYKLAENTINLAKTEQVHEIEIIHITLKTQVPDEAVLTAIDKAIPHPTLFICQCEGLVLSEGYDEIAYIACHKQKGESTKHAGKKNGNTATICKVPGSLSIEG